MSEIPMKYYPSVLNWTHESTQRFYCWFYGYLTSFFYITILHYFVNCSKRGNPHLLKGYLSSKKNLNTLLIYITFTLPVKEYLSINITEFRKGFGDFQSTALPTELPSQQQ